MHGMPIASTTGKPSTNSAEEREDDEEAVHRRALSGQHGVLFFGAAARATCARTSPASRRRAAASPTASGPMNSQNGISSVAVWLLRLLRDRDHAGDATARRTSRRRRARSPSCSSQRGRGGSSAWNSSIRICPPSQRHVRRGEERQADQEVARQLLRAGHRHVEDAAHHDLRERRDDQQRQQREADRSAPQHERASRHAPSRPSSARSSPQPRALLHRPDLLDVAGPLREVLVDLRQHRLAERRRRRARPSPRRRSCPWPRGPCGTWPRSRCPSRASCAPTSAIVSSMILRSAGRDAPARPSR